MIKSQDSSGQDHYADRPYVLPPLGSNPGNTEGLTTPGSFANAPQIAPGLDGALTFSSPDTPGMPEASQQTA